MKGIIPKVSRKAIIFSLICSVCGAILAGIYGILHDQITYSISPEYYTKLKFEQFELLNTTGSDRLKAAKIGFLATWVVGLIAGWLFGRTSYVNDNLKKSIRRVGLSFLYLISTAIIIALLASLSYHLWGGSYIGAVVGTIWVITLLLTQNRKAAKKITAP